MGENLWILIIPIIWLFFLRKVLYRVINKPDTHEELALKFCWIYGKNTKELFQIAAEETIISENKARDDFDHYLKTHGKDGYPHYVKSFLDSGKEVILSTKTYDYWKVF